MGIQVRYSQYHNSAYPGDLYGESRTLRTLPVRNNTSSDMVYGLMVANDASGTNGTSRAVRPVAAVGDMLLGVMLRGRYHAPDLAGSGLSGLAPNRMAAVVRGGQVAVITEQLVTTADPVYVRYGAGSASSGTAAWAASTAYTVGQRRTTDFGKIYECITAGTSASSGGPTGTSSNITDGTAHWKYVGIGITTDAPGAFRKDADPVTAWATSTAYTVGQRRFNDTQNVYECITAGTSASSGGPTGTTADITDGTAHWKFVGTCTASTGASAVLVPAAHWVKGTAEMDRFEPSGVAIVELNLP
jgi:hypothetical protein